MKYLEMAQIEKANERLASLSTDQPQMRIDAYSCKTNSKDKRILKQNLQTTDNTQLATKEFHYLQGTLNQLFPDNDFSQVKQHCFVKCSQTQAMIKIANILQ
jgi:hypothetical protein